MAILRKSRAFYLGTIDVIVEIGKEKGVPVLGSLKGGGLMKGGISIVFEGLEAFMEDIGRIAPALIGIGPLGLRGAALDLGFGDPKAIGKTTGGPLEAFKKA